MDVKLIISVGRLVGWKGLHIVVQALARLPDDIHYLAIGEGPELEKLQLMAKELGVIDRVHFVGRISHEELPKWFALGDVLVQPSIGEEAFGISVVEAMACGLPVLGSDNGGMKETVVPGETGYLLPRRDVDAWTKALGDILADDELRKKMGAAGRDRVFEHFTWMANAMAIELLLQGH
jgi:glycosyltransferase involved in cell wall biosynthesis